MPCIFSQNMHEGIWNRSRLFQSHFSHNTIRNQPTKAFDTAFSNHGPCDLYITGMMAIRCNLKWSSLEAFIEIVVIFIRNCGWVDKCSLQIYLTTSHNAAFGITVCSLFPCFLPHLYFIPGCSACDRGTPQPAVPVRSTVVTVYLKL